MIETKEGRSMIIEERGGVFGVGTYAPGEERSYECLRGLRGHMYAGPRSDLID